MTAHLRTHLLALAAEDEAWAAHVLRVGRPGSERNRAAVVAWITRAAVTRARVVVLGWGG